MPREVTSPNRLPNFSEKPKLYIIAAEGQKTEPSYFDALRKHYMFHHRESRVHIHILKRPPEDSGKSAPEYVEKMLEDFFHENSDYEFQSDYDEFWLVADTDKWQSQNAKLSALATIASEVRMNNLESRLDSVLQHITTQAKQIQRLEEAVNVKQVQSQIPKRLTPLESLNTLDIAELIVKFRASGMAIKKAQEVAKKIVSEREKTPFSSLKDIAKRKAGLTETTILNFVDSAFT